MKKQEEQIKMVLVAYITKHGKRQYIKRFSKSNVRSLAYTEIPEEACELQKSDIPILIDQLRKTANKPFMLKPMYLERIINRKLKKRDSDESEAESEETSEDETAEDQEEENQELGEEVSEKGEEDEQS